MSDTPATPTPWYVPLNQRAIYSESGNVVLSASASAKCGRAGDYYQCGDATGALHLTLKPEDLALIVLAVNSHATLLHQKDALVKALEEARVVFKSWAGPLRESADYMESHDVFPGTVHELRLAANFQQKAIHAITATLASIKE